MISIKNYWCKITTIPIARMLLICSQPFTCFSQVVWTSDPFGQKVFIENKGQFDAEAQTDSIGVSFGACSEGVDIYFTKKGLIYRHDEWIPADDAEEKEEGGKEKRKFESTLHFLSVEWVGANPNTQVISEEQVSFYYTYSGAGKDANSTIKANAYKRVIYKNLYPNIDVEYVFPKDSSGIKYSLILYPGANPSVIRMKYTNVENIFLDSYGNVVLKSSFGEFVDHAPKTFLQLTPPHPGGSKDPVQEGYNNGQRIESSFELSGSIVSFKISPLGGRGAVIDPWTTNPAFTGFNSAYDVNYDLIGNVYIFGSYTDFKLAKLDNTGAIQWIFNAVGMGLYMGNYHYGDFAVDEVSGTSYLVESFVNACRIFKVNTIGMQTGTFPGNPNMNEMWRVEYNRCINKIVIAGGGNAPCQAAMLDTNMVNIAPVNVLSATEGLHDMALLTVDNNNFCYMATATSMLFPATHDNILIKSPIPSLVPLAFSVSDGHKFREVTSINYVNNASFHANGMNGMTVSPCWLYTYDSDSLKRWDKNTGVFVAGIDVSPWSSFFLQISWGGLSADEYDNIYVGMGTSIKEYNTSLTLINTFSLSDTVYDIKLGPNSKLYACGKGFVTEIDVINTVTVAQTPASGCGNCNGTASVISCGTLSNFNYSWNTSPVQTAQTATGLCPGSYTVNVTAPVTNCSNGFTGIGTVTVTGSSGAFLSATVTATPATCNNNNDGSATVNIMGGAVPYVYLWSPTGGATATATGLAAGTYTATVTDANGCTTSQTVTVVASVSVTATATNSTICVGQAATLTASGGSAYSWSNGQTTASITITSTATTTYSVIVSGGTCSDTAFATVTVNSGLTVSAGSNVTVCTGTNVTLSANGGSSYSWSNGQTTFSITVNPTTTTTYTVIGTDNGCTETNSVTVVVTPSITANAGTDVTICAGDNFQLNASGGTGYSWIPSLGLNNSSIQNPIASPANTTTYTVVVTSGLCTPDSDMVTVVVNPNPIANAVSNTTITQGQSTTLTASGGGTYSWSNRATTSAVAVAPAVTTIYCVTVTDTNNCTDTACVTVTIEPLDCSNAGELFLPNAFSPNNDGENDKLQIYYGNKACIKTFKLVIYNRWGEKVFETTNPIAEWNGFYKEKMEGTAVFVYYMEAALINGEKIIKKGNVSLIR